MGDFISEDEEEHIHALGMELLQAASRSSRLASRYLTFLDHAFKEHNDKSPRLERGTDFLAHDLGTSLAKRSQEFGNPQISAIEQRFDFEMGVPRVDIDFMDFDGMFQSSGRPEDYSSGF